MVGRLLKKRASEFPPLQFTLEVEDQEPATWAFTSPFRIGREKECEVEVAHSLVSRTHVEFGFKDGQWWVHDLKSTNGLYHNGGKVQIAPLTEGDVLSLGKDGPKISVISAPKASQPASYPPMSTEDRAAIYGKDEGEQALAAVGAQDEAQPEGALPEGEEGPPPEAPVEPPKITGRYIAYIAAALIFAVAGGLFGGYQFRQTKELRITAEELFYQVRGLDVLIGQVRYDMMTQDGGHSPQEQRLIAQRDRLRNQYDGYVIKLGAYRSLEYEEQLVFNVARFFNESELMMPPAFKEEILGIIQNYWMTFKRDEYTEAIRRADLLGYAPPIVDLLQEYSLPPQLGYLVLQETGFRGDAVGAQFDDGATQRGMWHLTPETAERFGLVIPANEDLAVFDVTDERHDIDKATEAAIGFLSELYTREAEASGLLVLAAYHWSEHRVGASLETEVDAAPTVEAMFAGIPQDPSSRNYWTFLERYPNRVPQATRDYVMKIFAAAVIGQDPRYFGFEFENPLEPYVRATARQLP